MSCEVDRYVMYSLYEQTSKYETTGSWEGAEDERKGSAGKEQNKKRARRVGR